MSEENNFKEIEKFTWQRKQITITIAVITLVTIIIFGAIGMLLDNFFNTKPWLLIGSVVVSFPVTQVLIYKKAKKDIFKK